MIYEPSIQGDRRHHAGAWDVYNIRQTAGGREVLTKELLMLSDQIHFAFHTLDGMKVWFVRSSLQGKPRGRLWLDLWYKTFFVTVSNRF